MNVRDEAIQLRAKWDAIPDPYVGSEASAEGDWIDEALIFLDRVISESGSIESTIVLNDTVVKLHATTEALDLASAEVKRLREEKQRHDDEYHGAFED